MGIFDLLRTLAAQSELFDQDDITVRILFVLNENKMNTDKKKRTGQFNKEACSKNITRCISS